DAAEVLVEDRAVSATRWWAHRRLQLGPLCAVPGPGIGARPDVVVAPEEDRGLQGGGVGERVSFARRRRNCAGALQPCRAVPGPRVLEEADRRAEKAAEQDHGAVARHRGQRMLLARRRVLRGRELNPGRPAPGPGVAEQTAVAAAAEQDRMERPD